MILLLMDMKEWIFLAFCTSLHEMITSCTELACTQIQKIYFYEKLIHRMYSSVVMYKSWKNIAPITAIAEHIRTRHARVCARAYKQTNKPKHKTYAALTHTLSTFF